MLPYIKAGLLRRRRTCAERTLESTVTNGSDFRKQDSSNSCVKFAIGLLKARSMISLLNRRFAFEGTHPINQYFRPHFRKVADMT